VAHPNEARLRELYATFARGDLQGFLDGCTDDVMFTVPGRLPFSGVYNKGGFIPFILQVLERSEHTFQEQVLDVFANDEHGALLLEHEFDRAGQHRIYETIHICELQGGQIASWTEHPGSMREFEEAWGAD
jgi:ketosteroid isomerase-like protein